MNCHVFVRLCNSDDLVSFQAPYRVGKISHRRTTPRFPPCQNSELVFVSYDLLRMSSVPIVERYGEKFNDETYEYR